MTVSNDRYLKNLSDVAQSMGAKVISSDSTIEFDGYEQNYLLIKQFPWPELSVGGEIEVSGPLGTASWQPQQAKPNLQGQISMMETVAGSIDNMLISILRNRGVFDAMVYEGTPQHFLRAKRIRRCFLQIDSPDRDWENRSQPLMFTGTLFFHYFGEVIPGNSSDYT